MEPVADRVSKTLKLCCNLKLNKKKHYFLESSPKGLTESAQTDAGDGKCVLLGTILTLINITGT